MPLRLFKRLRVAVHRCAEGGMSQQFLHHLRVHAKRLDQSRECVPEGVPADFLGDAGASRRRLDVVPHDGRKPLGINASQQPLQRSAQRLG